jgi:hypothetical protein
MVTTQTHAWGQFAMINFILNWNVNVQVHAALISFINNSLASQVIMQ